MGNDFPAVTVCIVEVEASPLMQVVYFAIVLGRRTASVGDTFFPHPRSDRQEWSLTPGVAITLMLLSSILARKRVLDRIEDATGRWDWEDVNQLAHRREALQCCNDIIALASIPKPILGY